MTKTYFIAYIGYINKKIDGRGESAIEATITNVDDLAKAVANVKESIKDEFGYDEVVLVAFNEV